MVLRAEGSRLTGTVRVGGTESISEGQISGNTLTFKVTRRAGDIAMAFTGRLRGDEIAFTREVQVLTDRASPPNPILELELFPVQFTEVVVVEFLFQPRDHRQCLVYLVGRIPSSGSVSGARPRFKRGVPLTFRCAR
jgi:hypothetical protein